MLDLEASYRICIKIKYPKMKIIFFLVFLVASRLLCSGQMQADVSLIAQSYQKELLKEHANKWNGKKSFMLRAYKNFISSQDGSSCLFGPSCSVYAAHSLKNYGVLIGWFATSDRLLRCNTFTDEVYDEDENGKYLDP